MMALPFSEMEITERHVVFDTFEMSKQRWLVEC